MTLARAPGTRERLLTAARQVAARDGLEGLTLRAIARHAGVSHGAPLRHFPNLATLLAAVAADGFARLITSIDDAIATADRVALDQRGHGLTPTERIAVAGQAYVDLALAEPGVFAVTFRPERVNVNDPTFQEQGYRSFQQLVGLVEDAQADGWRPDEPAEVVAAVMWAHVHGLADLRLHGALDGILPPEQIDLLHRTSTAMTLGVHDLPGTTKETR